MLAAVVPALARLLTCQEGGSRSQYVIALAFIALVCLLAFAGGALFSDDYREALFPAFR